MQHSNATKWHSFYFLAGLFVSLYSSVERLLTYQDEADSNDSAYARCILFHELCPALHAIMSDGLKPEVITSFGKMPTSVWRVVEAVTRQGPSTGTATCDLVMLLNTRLGSASLDDDHRKFSGFIAGLIKWVVKRLFYPLYNAPRFFATQINS